MRKLGEQPDRPSSFAGALRGRRGQGTPTTRASRPDKPFGSDIIKKVEGDEKERKKLKAKKALQEAFTKLGEPTEHESAGVISYDEIKKYGY